MVWFSFGSQGTLVAVQELFFKLYLKCVFNVIVGQTADSRPAEEHPSPLQEPRPEAHIQPRVWLSYLSPVWRNLIRRQRKTGLAFSGTINKHLQIKDRSLLLND